MENTKKRVACFIDGFNLYHAIHDLSQPHLKWVNLYKLFDNFIDPNIHEICKVYYFSAYADWLPSRKARHVRYVNALKEFGVEVIMGRFKEKTKTCPKCKCSYTGHEEKETDVNIATWMVNEAWKDTYDEAFVVSNDSDLVPPIKTVMAYPLNKGVKLVAPPGRYHSKDLAKSLRGRKRLVKIKPIHLERTLLPERIELKTGSPVIIPDRYKSPKK